MKYLSLSILLIFGSTSFAQTNSFIECPIIGEKGQSLINSASALASSITDDPECADIKNSFAKVAELTQGENWTNIQALLKSSSTRDLSLLKDKTSIESISNTTEQISNLISQTVRVLTQSKAKCVKNGSKEGLLSGLSSVVKNISQTVSAFSGPYGYAINIGGNFVSQALSAVGQFIKAKNPEKYFFESEERVTIYQNQFCSYSNLLLSFNRYFKPGRELEAVENLNNYLDTKLLDMKENCEECNFMAKTINFRDSLISQISKIELEVPEIFEADLSRNLCQFIGTSSSSMESPVNQIKESFKSYLDELDYIPADIYGDYFQNSLKSRFEEVSFYTQVNDFQVPRCLRNLDSEYSNPSGSYITFLKTLPRLVSFLSEEILNTENSINNKYKDPLGTYIYRTFARKQWTANKVRELTASNSSQRNYVEYAKVAESKFALKSRYQRLIPSFLNYFYKKKIETKKIKAFSKDQSLYNEGKVSKDMLYNALNYSGVINQYCNYLDYINHQDVPGVADYCSKDGEYRQKITSYVSNIYNFSSQPSILFSVENPQWIEADGRKRENQARDFTFLIQNWNQKGDDRWLKKN